MRAEFVLVTWRNGDRQRMSAGCFSVLMAAKSSICCEQRIVRVEEWTGSAA
jgi:hypothetical protein